MMAVAYALSGQMDSARRAIAEAERIFPFWTIRSFFPEDPTSEARVAQVKQFQNGLRMAGARDHADEDADFGVLPNGDLHAIVSGYTATTAPGAKTIQTAELAHLLAERNSIILDFGGLSWERSVPGAIALRDVGVGGSFSDATQDRLRVKMRQLSKDDLSLPVVAVGWNSENFRGRNLTLRLVALGYRQVYWYRGGREASEVAGLPETDLELQDW
jgi:adenylate cyclase